MVKVDKKILILSLTIQEFYSTVVKVVERITVSKPVLLIHSFDAFRNLGAL